MSDASSARRIFDEPAAHSEFVRRLARSLVRDVHLADDVAQDSLVAAPERRTERRGALRAWLAGVVRNRVRMELRSAAPRGRRPRGKGPALAASRLPCRGVRLAS